MNIPPPTSLDAEIIRQPGVESQVPYAPARVTPDEGSVPVMRERKVKKVYLRGYKDDQGNAVGPSVKYVVSDEGGWDMDAINNPGRAYIPQGMTSTLPQPASPIVALAPGEKPTRSASKNIRDLYPIDKITVTGLVERNQEVLARETAAQMGPDFIPIFDEDLGWILVEKPALVAR